MTYIKDFNKKCKLVVCLLLLGFTSFSVSAVNEFVVKAIDVQGLQRTDLGIFFSMLPIQIGETIDDTRTPIIIRSIYSSGLFDDIRLYKKADTLVIKVNERPTISEITIDGNSDIKTEQILDAMKANGFAKGEIFDPSAIQMIKVGIEEQYFSHGKYSIKIEDKIIKQSRNRIKVELNVDEGKPAKIKKIRIIGNKIFTQEELLDQFELSVGGWFSFFSSSDQYSREKLSGDLDKLRSYYLDRGYLNYNNISTQVSISPDRKSIYVTINIEEGEKFIVDKITFSGELILTQDQLKLLMPLQKGDVYSAAAVSFAEERIKENFGYQGYAFAKVVTVPKLDKQKKTVELNLFLEPGKKVYINRINFSGNEMTNDQVLRREVRLMEGGVLSTQAVERSKLRLQRLSYLETVDVETPKISQQDDRVDVNFRVKERQAGNLQGGVGYSDLYKLSLNASVSHSNFLGSGNTVAFSINKNRFFDDYRVSYLDPYFTLDAVSAGASVYFRKSDFGAIGLFSTQQDSLGFDLTMAYPVNEVTRLSYGLGFEDSELRAGGRISEQVRNFYAENGLDTRNLSERDFQYQLYKFSLGWLRNTLNRGIFPDRGTRQSLTLSGALPNSDLNYYKLDYAINHYIPISPGWTFLSSFRASWGDGYGDSENLPYFENFSAGGSGTLRGFDSNSVGPRLISRIPTTATGPVSPDGGASPVTTLLPSEFDQIVIERRSAGGNARLLGTLELIFPIPFVEKSNSVRTSYFVDAGNLWDTKFALDPTLRNAPEDFPDYSEPDNFRVSTGFSLQWLAPIGPMTLSFSRVLKKADTDETEFFSFDIGRTF